MEQQDSMSIVGEYTVEVIRDGKNGPEVIDRRVVKNLIVNTGKKQLWRIAQGNSTSLFKFMRIGTSAAAAGSADTNVKSPVTGTLKTCNSFTLDSGRTYKWIYSYPSGAGSKSANGIAEMVILSQHTSPGGSALSRAILSPVVNKTTADKLKITYKARIT